MLAGCGVGVGRTIGLGVRRGVDSGVGNTVGSGVAVKRGSFVGVAIGDCVAPGTGTSVGAWVAGSTTAKVLLGIGVEARGGGAVVSRPWHPAEIDATAIINANKRYILQC